MLEISNVNRIFILLGSECNLNCKYCMQHSLVTSPITNNINTRIYTFLKYIANTNIKNKIHITFYGGEPLLYFNNIKAIVEATSNYCYYGIITNGKALTEDMISFCNAHDIHLTLSWDGDNVLKTRGYDLFADESKSFLTDANIISLTAVISSYTYPLDIINSFATLYNKYNSITSANLDIIFNTGVVDAALTAIDYDKIRSEMQDLCSYYKRITASYVVRPFKYKEPALENIKIGFISSLLRRLNSSNIHCECNNGYTVLNMDLQGNLYNCHNDRQIVGTIDSKYEDYIANVEKLDNCLHDIPVHCRECSVFPICKGGCKLIPFDKKIETGFCDLRKAIYEPVIELKKLIDKREQ